MSRNGAIEMRADGEDRRVRRTKDRLKAALLELIDEVGYDRITVRDLTDRADVGRSTFYSHFDSKEDLLFSGFDRWLLSLADAAEGGLVERAPGDAASGDDRGAEGPRFRFSLPLLKHARGQRRFFQAVVLRGGRGRVRRRLMALLIDVARRELERRDLERKDLERKERDVAGRGAVVLSDPDQERDARAHAVVGAFLGLVTWWFEDGREVDAGEVDRLFQETVG